MGLCCVDNVNMKKRRDVAREGGGVRVPIFGEFYLSPA